MKWFVRLGSGLLLLVVIMAVVGTVLFIQWTRAPLPQLGGTVTLAGLDDAVTIVRDDWGIPHIYATMTADLRFAQGYVHAQDRWWQMEFARHIGRGAIEELTGKNAELLGNDLFIRTVGWHRTAEQELAQLPPDILAELQAFSDGVNAYIGSRTPGQLALEYRILGLTGVESDVAEWTPLDSLLTAKIIAWDMSSSARTVELLRSNMLGELGEELTNAYWAEFPYGEKPTHIFPEELDEAGYRQALANANQATVPDAGIAGLSLATAGSIGLKDGFWLGDAESIGSNAWAISGEFTESGEPLLANDPHLGVQLPSIWYEVGLHCQPVNAECPYNLRGFAYTGLPGIVMGVNDTLAWGITSFAPDVIDFYRLEINPENELQYRWNGEWRDFVVHEEIIRFGNGGSLPIQIRETHFGPVMTDNQLADDGTTAVTGFVNEEVLAMHWTGWEPSTTVQALIAINRAIDWGTFREGASYLDVPAMNLIYADTAGNIGFQPTGRFPVRAAGHTGLLPVDGTGDALAWRGYIPFDYLPHLYNPERGYITLANQAATPLAYYDDLAVALADEFGTDAYYRFRTNWARGYRGQRLVELFHTYDVHSIATMQAMHADNKLIVIEEIAPYLVTLDLEDSAHNALRDWLFTWDAQMHADSPQAAFFGTFWHQLMYDVYSDQLGELADPTGGVNNMLATVALLGRPDHPWWDDITTDAVEDRDTILLRAFTKAQATLSERFGEDHTAWRWGDLHETNFTAVPLGASGVGVVETLVNISGVATSGGSATVNATRWDYKEKNPFAVDTIPSQRMIIDLGDYGNNLSIHATGQSGHAFSPHYDDMVEDWRMMRYHPMRWLHEDVERHAEHTLQLLPGPPE